MKKVTEAIVFATVSDVDKLSIIETDKMFRVVTTDVYGEQSTTQFKKTETPEIYKQEAKDINDIINHYKKYYNSKIFLETDEKYNELLSKYVDKCNSINETKRLNKELEDMVSLNNNQYSMNFRLRNKVYTILKNHPDKLTQLVALSPLFEKMKSAINEVYEAIEKLESGDTK